MEKTISATGFIKKLFNLKNLNNLILLFIIILGVLFLAGTNDLSVKGFALNDLKRERNRLADQNNKLELTAMALSSYGSISKKIGDLKMVAIGNVDYISVAGSVAKK